MVYEHKELPDYHTKRQINFLDATSNEQNQIELNVSAEAAVPQERNAPQNEEHKIEVPKEPVFSALSNGNADQSSAKPIAILSSSKRVSMHRSVSEAKAEAQEKIEDQYKIVDLSEPSTLDLKLKHTVSFGPPGPTSYKQQPIFMTEDIRLSQQGHKSAGD